MIDLTLIGIGTGNPEHLTLQAIRAMNSVELILIPRKGRDKADLADLRRSICAEVLTNPATKIAEFDLPKRDAANPDYEAGVDAWHDAISAAWAAEFAKHLPKGGRAALLVWGDPALYDSTLRIASRVKKAIPLTTTVIPGITSIQALAAAHTIPLNDVGAPFLVTTGRRLREEGWPPCADTLVVMLDGECSFESIAPEGVNIWWSAFAGMPEEIMVAGPLSSAGPKIVTAREMARAKHGWIMDIYVLRRSPA